MNTSNLIQILVFVLAAVIVVIFLASGIHFVRTVYHVQLEQERERHARQIAAHVAQRLREQQAVELKQRDGVLIEQPDGAHDLALFIECEDPAQESAEKGTCSDGPSTEEGASSAGQAGVGTSDGSSDALGAVASRHRNVWTQGPQPLDRRRGEVELGLPENRRPVGGFRAFLAAMNSQGFRY